MSKIAIVVIGYNRINSIKRLLLSLENAYYDNDNIDLIISIDKSDTDIIETYADQYQWKYGRKKVIKHKENLGLRTHILSLGVWFDEYDALIILEDDVVVSQSFYCFAKQTVNQYGNCSDIAGIGLYSYKMNYITDLPFEPIKDNNDVYFMKCAMSWGQIWLKKQWKEFISWYHENIDFKYSANIPYRLFSWPKSSWLKYHTRYCIENNKYFVYPYYSLSTNYSDVGEHNNDTNNNTLYQVPLVMDLKKEFILPNFDENIIKYDGYFELENLYQILGLAQKDTCIDLYNSKKNKYNKRYWLTTQNLPYHIIRSYGLNFRPAEANIILNSTGNDIKLYDTRYRTKCYPRNKVDIIMYRYYIHNLFYLARIYGIVDYFISPISTGLNVFFKKIRLL